VLVQPQPESSGLGLPVSAGPASTTAAGLASRRGPESLTIWKPESTSGKPASVPGPTAGGAPCHGERAEGKIGPNLTDEFWIHGDGTMLSIMNVVENGVLDKGMPAWGRQMRMDEVKKISAYVGSVRNTNEPGGKKAEGQRVNAL
jgi:mono/diheme cytochrome c family protein